MKRLLLSLILFFPTALAAQELHTFSNGEVADAEKINENFEALEAWLGSLVNATPGELDAVFDDHGYIKINVDCTAESYALEVAITENKALPRVAYSVVGECQLAHAEQHAGIDNQRIRIEGNCEQPPTILGRMRVIDSHVYLSCLLLGNQNFYFDRSVVLVKHVQSQPKGVEFMESVAWLDFVDPPDWVTNVKITAIGSSIRLYGGGPSVITDLRAFGGSNINVGTVIDPPYNRQRIGYTWGGDYESLIFIGEDSTLNCGECGGTIGWLNISDMGLANLSGNGFACAPLDIQLLTLYPQGTAYLRDCTSLPDYGENRGVQIREVERYGALIERTLKGSGPGEQSLYMKRQPSSQYLEHVGFVLPHLSSSEEIWIVTTKGFTAAFEGDFFNLHSTRAIDEYFLTEDCTGEGYAWLASSNLPFQIKDTVGHIGKGISGDYRYIIYEQMATGLQLKSAYSFDGQDYVCYPLTGTDTTQEKIAPVGISSQEVTGFILESRDTYSEYELRN